MAEQPRYSDMGIMPADIQRSDFANIRESVRQSQVINQNLDRLAGFAFKEAYEEAERKGMQFGIDNAPTIEQIKAAKEAGKSPEELFASPGTIFGDAARKIQASQLRNELEVKGRGELADISASLETGPVDSQEVAAKIKALTTGYANVIGQVSPVESLRFRASIGTVGNAIYAKASQRQAELYSVGLQEVVNDSLAKTSTILKDTFSIEADPMALNERVQIERQRVYDAAKQTGDPVFTQKAMAEFNKKLLNSVVDYAVSPEFAKNPNDGIRRLREGDLGRFSELYKSIDADKLKKQVIERLGDDATTWKRTRELAEEANYDEALDIRTKIYSGKITGPEGMRQLRALGVSIDKDEAKSLIKGDGTGNGANVNGEFWYNLEGRSMDGALGEEEIVQLAKDKKISWKQADQLRTQVRGIGGEQQITKADKYVRDSLGVVDPTQPGMGQEKARVAEVSRQIREEYQEAKASGKPFNPMTRAKELIEDKRTQEIIKSGEQKVTDLTRKFAKYDVQYDKNRLYTREDLDRLKIPKSEHDSILRRQGK